MKHITISTKENAIFIFDDSFTNTFSIWAEELKLEIHPGKFKDSFSISCYINSSYIGGFSITFDDCEITVESKKGRQEVQTIEELKKAYIA